MTSCSYILFVGFISFLFYADVCTIFLYRLVKDAKVCVHLVVELFYRVK